LKNLFKNLGVKASIITIFINIFLFLFKIFAGVISHSTALISDAIHSLSDSFTTIIVIFGLIISDKEADDRHPYGHERIESVFAIILSFFLMVTGFIIGYIAIKNLFLKEYQIITYSSLALIAAIVSILVKEGMYHYTMVIAKKINSPSMEADAWHHRSDALSSIGSLIGVLGAKYGFPILDSMCSIIICVLIVKSAIEVFIASINQLLDCSCDEDTKNKIKKIIEENKEVLGIKEIKTRIFGSKIYVDVEIFIKGNISLYQANKIVIEIHDSIESKISKVKHCNIHINPTNK